jgi:hypothetical protein
MLAEGKYNVTSQVNPFRSLLELYDLKKDLHGTLHVLTILQSLYPKEQSLKARIAAVKAQIDSQSVAPSTVAIAR